MKEVLALAGLMALSITPTASFADHLEPRNHDMKPGGNLSHTNLRNKTLNKRDLSRANLSRADLSKANLSGITANNLRVCPRSLPSGWVCENNSLIQR